MNMHDTLTIMAVLQEAYPRYYANKSETEAMAAASLWQNLFAEDNAKEVAAAMKAYIATDTKGFPPVIGQIKARLAKLKAPDMPGETEAWGIVSRAISRSAYHAAEEFEKLPPVIRKVVGSPSMLHTWALTEGKEMQTVVASNFMRAYRARAADAMELLTLPSDIRNLLENHGSMVELPAPPDPEEQKRHALKLLAESREKEERRILREEYDTVHDPKKISKAK